MTEALKGYRDLSSEDKNLINEGKMLGERIGEFIDRLRDMPSIDQRWLSIGTTDIQRGLMAVTRAIARPTNF
jgi:hypothetical protein